MNKAINSVGFWAGILAFSATVAYCVVQLLQLYRVFVYPTDEILIYSTSLCIVIPFLIEILALHYIAPDSRKFWSHSALIFTILYAVFVTSNYVVQLATVIPQTMQGKLDQVRILQQLPHSMFWDFDALGYIFMGLASFAAIPVFEKKGFQKWVRFSLIANATVTPFISIVYFYPTYSYHLLILGFPWAVTAPLFMLMIALWFRRNNTELKQKASIDDMQETTKKIKIEQIVQGQSPKTLQDQYNVYARAIITWLLFIPVVFLNATVRELVYKPLTGELAAHQISTVIASVSFFILAYLRLRNRLNVVGGNGLFLIGCMWLIMTVLFEFGLGRFVTNASWDKLLYDYNILQGRIWVLLLITLLLTPFIIRKLATVNKSNYQYSK